MASSSVSQESIDIEDYDLCTRRSRIRMMRGRTTAGSHKTEYHESMESGDHKYVKVRICTCCRYHVFVSIVRWAITGH